MSFLDRFWGFWNWLYNLIKHTNNSISSCREKITSSWHDVAIEIGEILPLETPNQPHIRGKDLLKCL